MQGKGARLKEKRRALAANGGNVFAKKKTIDNLTLFGTELS